MRSARAVALPIAGLLLATLYGYCAGAEIRVQGPANDVHVEAQGATVGEILAALGEHYAVRYRGTPGSSSVTATFEGPLRRVLVRVLQGNDYVIKRVGDGLEVIVLSLGSPAATSPAAPADIVRQRDPFMPNDGGGGMPPPMNLTKPQSRSPPRGQIRQMAPVRGI